MSPESNKTVRQLIALLILSIEQSNVEAIKRCYMDLIAFVRKENDKQTEAKLRRAIVLLTVNDVAASLKQLRRICKELIKEASVERILQDEYSRNVAFRKMVNEFDVEPLPA